VHKGNATIVTLRVGISRRAGFSRRKCLCPPKLPTTMKPLAALCRSFAAPAAVAAAMMLAACGAEVAGAAASVGSLQAQQATQARAQQQQIVDGLKAGQAAGLARAASAAD